MRIEGTNFSVTEGHDGRVWYDFGDGWKVANSEQIDACKELLRNLRKRSYNKTVSDYEAFIAVKDKILSKEIDSLSDTEESCSVNKVSLVKSMIDFFSEFHFEPNFRFINTFAFKCKDSLNDAKEYVYHYFELADSPYTSSVLEKMTSPEFTKILSDFTYCTPSRRINQRFKLYYGSQGTGKTTLAMKEADDCMVCHSAMLPSDLMEDFKFVDGNPEFQPSVLYRAIVEGRTIVLDEINLLPFESLRFLQSILDGKSEFSYKGKIVEIAEGFNIIGTMNLVVNGCTYSIPEPLIDRCSDLRKFKLTEKDLIGALD